MAILNDLKRMAIGASLKREVIALLRSPAVAKIDFRYGTFAVRGDDYHRLADDIARGAVGVFADTLSDGSGAEYHNTPLHPHPNSLVLPPDWIGIGVNLGRQMAVIHEATHALQDKSARNMNQVAAEAPAFVAEALWRRSRALAVAFACAYAIFGAARAAAYLTSKFILER